MPRRLGSLALLSQSLRPQSQIPLCALMRLSAAPLLCFSRDRLRRQSDFQGGDASMRLVDPLIAQQYESYELAPLASFF